MGSISTYLLQSADIVTLATISADSENPAFPATNLQQSDITRLFKTVDGTLTLNLLIDLGIAGYAWDFVSIINHNFGASASIALNSGTTAGANTTLGTVTYRGNDAYFRTGASRTHRYLRLVVSNIGNAHGHLSIGKIQVGLAVTLAVTFQYDWLRQRIGKRRMNKSELNSKRVNRLVRYFSFNFSYNNPLTNAQLAELTGWTDSLDDGAQWFFFIPDNRVYDGYAVRLMNESVDEIHGVYNHVPSILLEEESRGRKIGA